MADSIVACPGCGKTYSVPEGVPPGQFQCQDCSAMVPYGAPAKAGPPGRSAGKAAGRKKAARGRTQEKQEAQDGRGARGGRGRESGGKKEDPTPYILGIVAVAIVGLLLVVMNNRSKSRQAGTGDATAAADGSGRSNALSAGSDAGAAPDPDAPAPVRPSPDVSAAEPDDTPAARTPGGAEDLGPGARVRERPGAKETGDDGRYDVAANPPTGGNYGKDSDELRSLARTDRKALISELDHLPDTSADQKQEIDRLVGILADPHAGREAVDAQHRLIAIGRAAIPRLLSAAARQDFSKFESMRDARDPCVVADAVDSALREITGKTNITKLQFNPDGNLRVYDRVIENWYVWWLNSGYERASFPKPKESVDGEE